MTTERESNDTEEHPWTPPDGVSEVVDVRLLWESDRWDGPLSGACEAAGERFWFNRLHDQYVTYRDEEGEPDISRIRYFGLHRLAPAAWEEEDRRHALFRKKVGTHCDYNEHGCRDGDVHPSATHHEFYDAYPPSGAPRHEDAPMVGWFWR